MSDIEILRAVNADADKGFRLLVETYGEPLYWHIRRTVVSHHDAEDVLQEAFIRIHRSLNGVRQPRALRAWLYRIATREALRFLERNPAPALPLEQEAMAVEGAEYFDYSDAESVRLKKVIAQLPPRQQAVFNLRYYDELPFADIATALDSTPGAVKANYHLAKEQIIKCLSNSSII